MPDDQSYEIFEWIGPSFLNKILETYEGISVNIIEHEVKHATAKGEGFLGAIFRAVLKYTVGVESSPKNISLILKAGLEEDCINEITADFNIFQRETQTYKYIIKESMKLLHEVQDETVFGPKLIYADERVIVLEDLSVRGYKMQDCKKRLHLKECKMVLEKVAKFHATTAVLHTQNPSMFQYHKKSNITENDKPIHLIYKNTLNSCIKYAKSNPQLYPYIEKLEAFGEQVIERMIDVFKRDDESFNVLNHGDLWVNNFMFHSNDKDETDDVLLIDYQEGFFGSPGIDLNWFVFTSCTQEVLDNDIQTLYQFYYDVLVDTLKKLKYPKNIPSYKDILNAINEKAYHGLATLICFTAIFLNKRTEYADAVNFISDTKEAENIRTIIFDNPEYAKLLIDNFPVFIKNGQF